MILGRRTVNVREKQCLIGHLDVFCLSVSIENRKYLKRDKRLEQVLLF